MGKIRKLFILIICLNNDVVKGDMFEELLISVNHIKLNMETVMHKVENLENTLKETDANVVSIRDDVKILHNEVEKNSKQNILILEELGTFKEKVKRVQEEQNAIHSNMNLQYPKILEEVKLASSINQNLDMCAEKYSKHSNAIKKHLNSLQEEVKSVQDSMKNAEEINLNIKENVKYTSNNSDIILKQIKVFKDEVFSLEEENTKKFYDIGVQLLGGQKLYSDNEYDYYKVPVSNGTTLVEGTVPYTCEKVGMKAVCNGPATGCVRVDLEKCVVTPLSSPCFNPMYPLSKILCDGKKPHQCSQLEGVFSYMKDYVSECGAVDGNYCARGADFTSGETIKGRKRIYYGYCAKRK